MGPGAKAENGKVHSRFSMHARPVVSCSATTSVFFRLWKLKCFIWNFLWAPIPRWNPHWLLHYTKKQPQFTIQNHPAETTVKLCHHIIKSLQWRELSVLMKCRGASYAQFQTVVSQSAAGTLASLGSCSQHRTMILTGFIMKQYQKNNKKEF